jgi:hypothetical protein
MNDQDLLEAAYDIYSVSTGVTNYDAIKQAFALNPQVRDDYIAAAKAACEPAYLMGFTDALQEVADTKFDYSQIKPEHRVGFEAGIDCLRNAAQTTVQGLLTPPEDDVLDFAQFITELLTAMAQQK